MNYMPFRERTRFDLDKRIQVSKERNIIAQIPIIEDFTENFTTNFYVNYLIVLNLLSNCGVSIKEKNVKRKSHSILRLPPFYSKQEISD